MLLGRQCTEFFCCAMLSELTWALHGVSICAMLPLEYYDNIEQDFFMWDVVWSFLENTAQGF